MKLDFKKINKVYLSGIGGIGLSALAYYFLENDKEVIGSDLESSDITKKLEDKNVEIHFKQKEDNITTDIDMFIYSSALSKYHPELLRAKELNIPCVSYFKFLGLLSKEYTTIAVTGTNGKTTTTAILGLMLEKVGLDPTVIVGSIVPQWNSNFRLGKSNILVVEACEWKAHMLEIDPNIIVLTNIAEDHLDYYTDLKHIKKTFQKFVDKLPKDGLLIKNKDDDNSIGIHFKGKTINFGKNEIADYSFNNLSIKDNSQYFTVNKSDKKISDFVLPIPGEYNIYNTVSSIVVADYLGINKHQIWNSVNEFNGVWRRFEKIGKFKNNLVISDYAHHPDSIQQLLKAVKDFYPDNNLIAIFQPHHHNRTKTLLKDFAKSFKLADSVIINKIYQVQGREDQEKEDITSLDLIKAINQDNIFYAENFKDIKKILRKINPENSIILFIGAGDIDNLAREIIK